jgi:hypothetical protein
VRHKHHGIYGDRAPRDFHQQLLAVLAHLTNDING